MKPISGKQLARLLEKHGWQLLRIQGSHHIYGRQAALSGFLCLFTETDRSRWACCTIFFGLPA